MMNQSTVVMTGQPVNWSHPLNRNLVSWWLRLPGHGVSFQMRDLCGRGHGAMTGMSPASDWVGPNGRPGGWGALDFDGSDDAVTVTRNSLYDFTDEIFTLSMWIRIGTAANKYVIGTNPTDGWAVQMRTTGPQLRFVAVGITVVTTTLSYPVNTWKHFTVTCRPGAGNCKLYTDGLADATATIGNITNTSDNLTIGWNGTQFANVQLDDIRIYNRDLAASEVREVYRLSQVRYPGLLNRLQSWSDYVPAAAAAGGVGMIFSGDCFSGRTFGERLIA